MKKLIMSFLLLSLISCASKGTNEPSKDNPTFQLSADAQREVDRLPSELARLFREYYGSLPEWAAQNFDQSTAKAIGDYYGGLEGDDLALASDNAYKSIKFGFADVKKASDDGLPVLNQELILNIAIHAAIWKNMMAHDSGIKSKDYAAALEYLDKQQATYDETAVTSVKNSDDSQKSLKLFDKEFVDFKSGL